jgi:hypothetical protein
LVTRDERNDLAVIRLTGTNIHHPLLHHSEKAPPFALTIRYLLWDIRSQHMPLTMDAAALAEAREDGASRAVQASSTFF